MAENESPAVMTPSDAAGAYVRTAVAKARVAAPNTNVKLVVAVHGPALRAWVEELAAKFASKPVDATLAFRGDKPVGTPDRPGRRLATREGIFCGCSSGANVVAALQVAATVQPGAVVVTLVADTGLKYLSTDLF